MEDEKKPTLPPYDPVAETKAKLLFAVVAIVVLAFLKFGLGW
jgi:hypothetical protein